MTTAGQNTTASLFAGLEDDRESASQYLSIFIDEAQSTLDELIEALLALETGGGKKQVAIPREVTQPPELPPLPTADEWRPEQRGPAEGRSTWISGWEPRRPPRPMGRWK